MLSIIWFIVGAAVGALVCRLAGRGRASTDLAVLRERLEEKQRQADELGADLRQLQAQLDGARGAITEQQSARSRLEATLENERRGAEEKIKLLNEARENLRVEFENLANRIFDEKSRRFTVENKENLQLVLTPLKEHLDSFRKRVDDVHQEGIKERASLLHEVKTLRELNRQIGEDAVNLTRALKGESKTQGNWGELILERVLEQSGLTRGREYETQLHLKERYGGTQSRYPDVVVHLPEGKDVVIDSKVSLKDYEACCAAETEEEREAAFKAHLRSLRSHIAELSAKSYESLEGIRALDIVVMCVPSEAALIAAVSRDNGLYEEAFRKRIMLVGPSTLLLALRIIATIWRHEDQNRNTLEIAERGQLLYEKFVGFVEDLDSIGKGLDNTRAAYEQARGKLHDGAGNLVGQAQKLIKLGVKARKQLPPELVEKSESALLTDGTDADPYDTAAPDGV
jgi:DNA recombination protein RmuC